MSFVEPISLANSWPLWEQPRHFELGHVLNCAVTDILEPALTGQLGLHHVGCWECDLADNSLVWSGGVYDIFGFPRGVQVSREEAVGRYCEDSRARLEHLRRYAIKHKRGFTLDVDIQPVTGSTRSMRLIAAPVCDGGRAARLHGLKLII